MSPTDGTPEDAVVVGAMPGAPPPKGPGDRQTGYYPTKAERHARISQIYELLMAGLSRADLSRYVSQKTTWEISERTIDRYVQAATALFAKLAQVHRETELGRSIARLNDLYARSARIQDYKTALACTKELNELLGLYAPKHFTLDPDEEGRGGFIAVMPARPVNHQEWEAICKAEQQARQPTIIGSTSPPAAG